MCIRDRIMACLKEENLYAVELGGVKPNPRSGLVYEGIDLCRREKIDFILAVGGGSVIDTAKAIAIGVPYDGDFWDFFSGKVPEQALPVGTVLTIAASGSEGSPAVSYTHLHGAGPHPTGHLSHQKPHRRPQRGGCDGGIP